MSKKTEPPEALRTADEIDPSCPTCLKDPDLCLCSSVSRLPTKLHVVILQHPQEPDKTLGSARLAHTALANSTLKVGLSWPNLSKILGRPAENAKWGVLYLGGKQQVKPGTRLPRLQLSSRKNKKEFIAFDEAFDQDEGHGLEGIIVLDGTWAQAKTLWWRNAWLLKLRRIVLNPQTKSLYGQLRREPRRECLSTIEAIAETLDAFGEKQDVTQELKNYFVLLLKKFRERSKPAEKSLS